MLQANAPIGVMDSGVGGLTVVRELRRLLPGEDILYFGDSANCPYGNRSSDEIFALSCAMLRFFASRGVKCAAVACNTISTLIDRLRPEFPFRIIDIIGCSADYVVRRQLTSIGLFATEFTVASGAYDVHIHAIDPKCTIVSKGSPLLAAMIDHGNFDPSAIDAEIRAQVGTILSRAPVEDLLLACTHFPIVEENFRRCFPQLNLIDPAHEQALTVQRYLAGENALNAREQGRLTICTSGEPDAYVEIARRLGIGTPDEIRVLHL